MLRRTFGDTNLEVSAISLGCWIFGVDWWGHYTDERGVELCRYAYDQGVTFFDNGDAYGNGRAETILGKFLRESGIPRDKIEIGGKFGYDFYSDPGEAGSHRERKQDFSPAFLRKAHEESLKRLGVDHIDLYMAHNIKLPEFRDDMFAELEKMKDEGKIKVWGVSLGPAIGWREEGFKAMLDHGAKAVQTVFNLFEQHPGREFCETAVATRAGVLARVHDNSSILKDAVKVDTTIGKDDHRKFRDQSWKVYGLKKLELIRHYAADHGMNVHELACKWLLQQPGMTSITGTLLNEKEIAEACEATSKPDLSGDELAQIAKDYSTDWNLGPEAHPCDLKSSDPDRHDPQRVRSVARPDRMKMEPRASGLRYVVLHHSGDGEDHFDLMFEVSQTDPLMTLRSPVWPIVADVQLTPLNEHRREYLTYEGPISGNRGEVKRVASGTYDLSGDGIDILITFTSGADVRPIIIESDGFCRPHQ